MKRPLAVTASCLAFAQQLRHSTVAEVLTEAAGMIDRLEAALKPFAAAFEDYGAELDAGERPEHRAWEHPIAMNITLGDFIRAYKLIHGSDE